MGDWDTLDPSPNGHAVKDRKLFTTDGTPQPETPYFDNPAYRDDVYATPVYRKNRTRLDEHANHLIYDVSKSRPATIGPHAKKHHTSSGSRIIRKNTDEYGTNRYSEPVVLNVRQLDKMAALSRQHHSVGRAAANVYYTKSRNAPQKKHQPTAISAPKRQSSADRKASCISYFDIETDKVDSYQYRPGEEVTGSLTIVVKSHVEVRYVELQVIGQGVLTVRDTKDGIPRTIREVYLKKSTCVIGSSDSAWTSLLTPGHYTSKFRIKLPPRLPSSQFHDDTVHGFTFDLNYTLKGRVCDDVNASTSSRSSLRHGMVKAIVSKKIPFNVVRSFDINNIPSAKGPLTKTEQIMLSCTHHRPATVTVTVERAVFLAGDDIRLQVATSLPASQRIKEVTCCLQEHLVFGTRNERLSFTIAKVEVRDPLEKYNSDDLIEIAIPTQTNLVSSFALGQGQMRMAYTLEITIRFKPAGGKLFFQIPIGIGPCAEPIYGEKTSTKKVIPVFNRPTRFPTFSNHHNGAKTRQHSAGSNNTTSAASTTTRNVHPVKTRYSNGFFARCFLCCRGMNSDD